MPLGPYDTRLHPPRSSDQHSSVQGTKLHESTERERAPVVNDLGGQAPDVASHDARADGNSPLRARHMNVQVRSWQEPRWPFHEDAKRRQVYHGEFAPGAQSHPRDRRERIRDVSYRTPSLMCFESRVPVSWALSPEPWALDVSPH